MTETLNEITNGDSDRADGNSEPLLVSTNTTLDYDASENSNLTYDTENEPLAVGTNLTIEITYAEAELIEEQLGISLDGSDNYLGSNITVIDGNSDWLERIDGNPIYSQDTSSFTTENNAYSYSWDSELADGSIADYSENEEELATEVDFLSDSNEPLLVGTNITLIVEEDLKIDSETEAEEESQSERDDRTPFALGTNMLLNLPDDGGQQDSYLGTNLSTIDDDSQTQTSAMEGDSFGGMMSTEEANPTYSNDDYAWDFNGQFDRFSSNDSEGIDENVDPDALFAASPWGALEETGAIDGFEDVFPNAGGEIENNPFAGGFSGGEI